MITRLLTAEIRDSRKSILLLGPRQVGKSTLIKSLRPEFEINLADELQFLRYSSQPGTFKADILDSEAKTLFIDEIQRIPALLNSVQVLLDEDKGLKFYLTGSSARKLKRGHANLLPGRVLNFYLGPLVAAEMQYKIDTRLALEIGCLPEVHVSKNRTEQTRILKSYAANYLKEEIKSEALVRNLDAFARFLQEATLAVGDFIDLTKMSKHAKISRHAIPRHFEILEDTLIGHRIYPFPNVPHSVDLVKHPKFYFFDNGVYNGLLGNFTASLDRVGKLAEQLIHSQLLHSSWAKEKEIQISTFRTRAGAEVDFIVELNGDIYGIEVKNSDDIQSSELEGLREFQRLMENKKTNLFIFHMGKLEKRFGKIQALPWQKGLKAMGL
jgi:predicted AAA+ superfamily ATPase